MRLYTTGRYGDLNPGWHEEDAPDKASAVASMLRALGLRPRSIVDVGCGTGAILSAIKESFDEAGLLGGCRYEGWDPAPRAIAAAEARAADRLRFVCGDVLSVRPEFEGAGADVLLCLDTFEHVGDDVAFLEALRARADWFVFRIPLDLSALDVMRPRRLLEARHRYGHRHAYTRALALARLAEAGFETVGWRYHRIPPKGLGTWGRAVDLARRVGFAMSEDVAVDLVGGWSLIAAARPSRAEEARSERGSAGTA